MAQPAWVKNRKKTTRRKAWWQSSKRKGRGFRLFGIRLF